MDQMNPRTSGLGSLDGQLRMLIRFRADLGIYSEIRIPCKAPSIHTARTTAVQRKREVTKGLVSHDYFHTPKKTCHQGLPAPLALLS